MQAKARFDATAEELERILVAKEGENYRDAGMRNATAPGPTSGNGSASGANKRGLGKAMTKGLFKGKNPAQMQRHEDDVRSRMAAASEAFRKAVLESQALRQEYFNFQLPKIVRVRARIQRLSNPSAAKRLCRRARPGGAVPPDTICVHVRVNSRR